MHSETNSVSIQNPKQDLAIEFDFASHLSIVRLMTGHFKASITDINLLLDVELTQQDVNGKKGLAIDIVKNDFELSASTMDVQISGGVTELVIQSITRLFKKTILNFIVKEVKSVVSTTLVQKINKDLASFVMLSLDSLKLDLSLVQPPKVTDDNFLSIFVTGMASNVAPIFKEELFA